MISDLFPGRWLLLALLGVLLLGLVLAACGPQPSGERLVQERCTDCHTLAVIEVAAKPEHEWLNTVYRMIKEGAELSDREAEVVIDYLSQQYGPRDF